jgi:hypothetical protein
MPIGTKLGHDGFAGGSPGTSGLSDVLSGLFKEIRTKS